MSVAVHTAMLGTTCRGAVHPLRVLTGVVLLFLAGASGLSAQDPAARLDSLQQRLADAASDTLRAQLLVGIADAYTDLQAFDSAHAVAGRVIVLARDPEGPVPVRTALLRSAARAHLLAGISMHRKGDLPHALDRYFKSAKILETVGTPASQASVYMNIAAVYSVQGASLKAFMFYQRSLEGMLASGNKRSIGYIHQNLGNFHSGQGEFGKALEHYEKGIAYLEQVAVPPELARAYQNLSHVYRKQGAYGRALGYARRGFALIDGPTDSTGLSAACNAMGLVFLARATQGRDISSVDRARVWHGDLDSAEHYLKRSLAIERALDSDSYLAFSLSSLADVARLRGQGERAQHFYEEAVPVAKRMAMGDELLHDYKGLSAVLEEAGRYREALHVHRLYAVLSDSMNNAAGQKELGRLEAKAEYEREALLVRKERERADALLRAKVDKQALQRNSLMGGLGLTLVLASVGYRSYQNKRRAYAEVQYQKGLLEERNKDITDSIRYAQRIQEALLPSVPAFRSTLPDSFILYRPKDIVSGDFYWFERKDDRVLLAVVDCTGHGVPGALMTIVANHGLTKALGETTDAGPAEILDHLNSFVNESLRRTYEKNVLRDGMDISLCVLDLAGRRLRFAGANHPLLLIRDSVITEIKGDKHPVGVFVGDTLRPFTEHEVQLQENDRIYLFTDGFTDQFGGEQGKKFMSNRLKALLLSVQERSMAEQRRLINEALLAWKGDLDQVDDMCMVGLRIHV